MAQIPARPLRNAAFASQKLAERPASKPDKSSPDEALNREIVRQLQRDGRRAFSEIADKLNVSEGTIRNRVAAMKEAGTLRIVAVVDPVAGRYDTDAMLGIKVAPGISPSAVAERLGALTSVVYILWVGGRFDLLIEVVADDQDAFLQFLDAEIHGQPDIVEIETMMGLRNFKNQFLLKSDWEEEDA